MLDLEPEGRPLILHSRAASITLTGEASGSFPGALAELDPNQDDVQQVETQLLQVAAGHIRRTGETITVDLHATYTLELESPWGAEAEGTSHG